MADDQAAPNEITPKTLKELCGAFAMFCRLKPWAWVQPSDFFGIRLNGEDEPVFVHCQNPTSGHPVSVMLIFGWRSEALYQYILDGLSHPVMRFYEIDRVNANLQPAELTAKSDRELAAAAGVMPDADGNIPVFLSNVPGWIHWDIDEKRAAICTEVLRQASGVIMRGEADPSLFRRDDPGTVWVRTCGATSGEALEEWAPAVPFFDFSPSAGSMPPAEKFAQANAIPDDIDKVELDIDVILRICFLDQAQHDSNSQSPPVGFFMAMCCTDPASGLPPCLGNRIFYPRGDFANMWDAIPEAVLDIFIEAKHRPREIVVSSPLMMDFLRPLQTKIHFKLTFHSELKYFNAIFKRTTQMVDEALQKYYEELHNPEENTEK